GGGAVFLPGGRRVAVWGDEDGVGFWDGRSADLEGALDGPTGWVVALALSPDGRLVAAVHVKDRPEETRVVHLYEGDSGQEVGRFAGHQGLVTCLAFGAGGRVLVSGSDDGTVLAWGVTGRAGGGGVRGSGARGLRRCVGGIGSSRCRPGASGGLGTGRGWGASRALPRPSAGRCLHRGGAHCPAGGAAGRPALRSSQEGRRGVGG